MNHLLPEESDVNVGVLRGSELPTLPHHVEADVGMYGG